MFSLKNHCHTVILLLLGLFAVCNVAATSFERPRSLVEEGLLEEKEQKQEENDKEHHEALLLRSLSGLSARQQRRNKKQLEHKLSMKLTNTMLSATVNFFGDVLSSDDFIDRSALTADQLAQLYSTEAGVHAMNVWLKQGGVESTQVAPAPAPVTAPVPAPVPNLTQLFAFFAQLLTLGTGGFVQFLTALQTFLCTFPYVPC